MIEELTDALDVWIPRLLPPWWVWPTILVLLALASLGASLVFQPGPDEFTYLGSERIGGICAFVEWTGQPCPQCGMTRSWMWAARGDWLRAAAYNPAGFTLFLWLQAGGIVGAARLVRRDKHALEPPFQWIFGWTMFWLVGLYALPWIARLAGINPLP